jgi:carbon monoxide dehydrogenase subunit G
MKAINMEFVKNANKTIVFTNNVKKLINKSSLEVVVNKAYSIDDQRIEITCKDNILENIDVKIQEDKITVRTNGSFCTNKFIFLEIFSYNYIEDVILEGSGDILIKNIDSLNSNLTINGSGDINVNNLKNNNTTSLNINGSGDLTIYEGNSKNISCKIKGSGDMYLLDFNAKEGLFSVMGSGDIENSSLIVNKAKVKISGSGDIEITVKDEISSEIKGSGDATIYGNPSVLKDETKGSGELNIC